MFQSAPCTEVQGDCRGRGCRCSSPRFNPLPAPKYREIVEEEDVDVLLHVSIRSLHRSTGRCMTLCSDGVTPVRFQSAPCTRVQGDLQGMDAGEITEWFQSVPCTRVQGDLGHHVLTSSPMTFQSAPCTRVQGDECPRGTFQCVYDVSIRLPAPEYREIPSDVGAWPPLSCGFNPLPAPEYREIEGAPCPFID